MKVVIVGRPNVGKSTLFNRLIEKEKSIVSKEPGTTRDRISGQCLWRGNVFELIDIGGIKIEKGEKEILEKKIQEQIEIAIKEGDLILFLLDGKIGLTAKDQEIAKKLKKLKKPIFLVINKIDSPKERERLKKEDFLKLGFKKMFLVSAINGAGLGDLLDEIIKEKIKIEGDQEIVNLKNKTTKIAIIGRTNVGKSTLVNSLLGEERVIVTPLPHTTREPIDTIFKYKGKSITLIDTAGIRKKTKIKSQIEKIGVEKSLKMIKEANIVFLVLDILEPVSSLDKKLASLTKEEKRGLILVINKFDLAKGPIEKYIRYYQGAMPSFRWAPIIFISAKEKINLEKLLDLALEIKEKMEQKFKQEELNKILKETINKYNFKEKFWLKSDLKQENKKPVFLLCLPKLTRKENPPSQAQIDILEKELRKRFNLWGIPLEIKVKI